MVTIAHLSDVHLRPDTLDSTVDELWKLATYLNDAMNPEYTIILGELITDAEAVETDFDTLSRMTGLIDSIESAVRYFAHNHDVGNLSKEALTVPLVKTCGVELTLE